MRACSEPKNSLGEGAKPRATRARGILPRWVYTPFPAEQSAAFPSSFPLWDSVSPTVTRGKVLVNNMKCVQSRTRRRQDSLSVSLFGSWAETKHHIHFPQVFCVFGSKVTQSSEPQGKALHIQRLIPPADLPHFNSANIYEVYAYAWNCWRRWSLQSDERWLLISVLENPTFHSNDQTLYIWRVNGTRQNVHMCW